MLFKKLFSLFLAATAIFFACYFFQDKKLGKQNTAIASYALVPNWPKLPAGFVLGNPTGIGIDSSQNIFIFHRADRKWPFVGGMPAGFITANTILLIDKENGQILHSWGANLFIMPHGLTVDSQNNVWVTDVGLHQVFKFSHEGVLLLKIGEAKLAGNDSTHFNRPTDIAIAPDGSFYVSDGYVNSRVVKFSSSGKYLFEWGKKGNQEGEFDIPHGISLDKKGNVYVADRENNRVQIFDSSGKFLEQYADPNFGNICSVAIDQPNQKLFAVDDLSFLKLKHRGSDIFIFDTAIKIPTRFGRSGSYTGPVCWYHDVAVDDQQNIYVGDILGNKVQKFRKDR
jgi:peptidylamidoglycolate lyase